MSAHSSILGGSNAARLLACPASYLETQRSPLGDIESVYAAEGTMLHGVIAHMVKKGITPQEMRTWDWPKISKGKFDLTEEQVEAVAVALEQLEILKDKYKDPAGNPWKILALEKTLPLPGVMGAFGSVDLILINPVTVLVVDWKFGQGVPVYVLYPVPGTEEETLNPQAAFYAAAARGKYKSRFKDREIVLAIVQPRIVPPMSYTETSNEELDDFVEAFKHAVIEALDRRAHRERGDHCRFASCKATCSLWTGPVFDLAVLDPAAAALKASQEGAEMTEYGAFLSRSMDLAEIAEAWAEEIRTQAHRFLEDGGAVRGWKLVPKRGTRQWIDPEATPAALTVIGALKDDIYTAPELRSVADAEKTLKKKGIKLPSTLFRMVDGKGTTITRTDDPRQESTHGAVANELRLALRAL